MNTTGMATFNSTAFTIGTSALTVTAPPTATDLSVDVSEAATATSAISTLAEYLQTATVLDNLNNVTFNSTDNQTWFNTTIAPFSGPDQDRLLTVQQAFVFNAVIGGIGVLGNLLVCFVFLRDKKLRTLTNFFILNQSVIDLLTSIAFLANKCGPKNIWVPPGIWGELLCKLWLSGYLMWSLIMTSSVNLTAMTLERYFAMMHPMRHRYGYTWTKARVISVFVWLFPFSAELLWAFANHNGGRGRCYIEWYSQAASMVSGVLFFCIEWVFPVTAMAVTYISILRLLRRRSHSNLSEGAAQPGPGANRSSPSPMERARRNVTKTLFTVSVAYLVCWTLQAWEYFLYSVVKVIPLFSVFHDFAVLLAFTNMCVNPFIYSFQYESFRDGVARAFCCRSKQEKYHHNGTTTTKTGVENISMTVSHEYP